MCVVGPPPTYIYTLSLHDALPILSVDEESAAKRAGLRPGDVLIEIDGKPISDTRDLIDRKSTRLNSSHSQISYAVFCLKKKTKSTTNPIAQTPWPTTPAMRGCERRSSR